jgi:uncharacterized protein YcbK (DUF882 family)
MSKLPDDRSLKAISRSTLSGRRCLCVSAIGIAVAVTPAWASLGTMRELAFDYLHTGERISLACCRGGRYGEDAPFQVGSGYRSAVTNEMLNDASSDVATNSLHMQGMAKDVRVSDTRTSQLREALRD